LYGLFYECKSLALFFCSDSKIVEQYNRFIK